MEMIPWSRSFLLMGISILLLFIVTTTYSRVFGTGQVRKEWNFFFGSQPMMLSQPTILGITEISPQMLPLPTAWRDYCPCSKRLFYSRTGLAPNLSSPVQGTKFSEPKPSFLVSQSMPFEKEVRSCFCPSLSLICPFIRLFAIQIRRL